MIEIQQNHAKGGNYYAPRNYPACDWFIGK